MSRYIKVTSIALYFFCSVSVTFSQDLLINAQGDSLNIHTDKIEHGFLYYHESGQDDMVMLAANKIQLLIPGHFDSNISSSISDLLVKSGNDSLKISTIKIEGGYSYFQDSEREEEIRYPVNRIQLLIPDYFTTKKNTTRKESRPSHEMLEDSEFPTFREIRAEGFSEYPTFRFSAQGGWSIQLAPIDSDLSETQSEYEEGLRTGWHFSAGLDIYFHKYLGFGLGYTYFNTHNRMTGHQVTNPANGQIITGALVDNISVDCLDIRLIGRYPFKQNRYIAYVHIGMGQIWYVDKQFFAGANYQITGETFSGNCGIGIDFRFDKSIAIGIQSNLIFGHLKELKVEDVNVPSEIVEESRSVSRFDLSIGLRWYFDP